MKNRFLFLTAIFLTLFSTALSAEQAKKNVGVLDLKGRGISEMEALTLTDKLRGELIKTGKYTVLERSQMNEVLKEQGFQQSGCTSEECVIEMGQMVGVQQMVAGSIGKVGRTYLVSLRMIDVETAKIVKSVDHQVKGEIDDVLLTGMPSIAQKMAGIYEDSDKSGTGPKEEPQPTVKKKKGFPWGWMVVGVLVAGGAAGGYLAYDNMNESNNETGVETGTVQIDWQRQ